MGVGYNPKIVTNGLLGHWDAGNTKSYPGSGTTWTDLIGKITNSSTSSPTPTYNSSFGGYFNMNNAYNGTAYFPLSDNLFTATANFSMSLWARLYTYDGVNRARCFSLILGSTLIQFGYLESITYSNSLYVRVTNPVGNSTFISRSVESVNLSTWAFYTLSCTGTVASFYKNATLLTTTTSTVPTADTLISAIGSGYNGTAGFSVVGDIATASYYNVALSAEEVLQNYNALRGRFGI